ncbi:hypothetical protein BH24ACT1_BH24ACT1_03530 [soil metagenome]
MTAGGAGDDELVYDLADWDPDQRSRLDGILTAEGVAYRWEGGVVGSSWMAPGPVSGPGSPPQASDQLVVTERHAELVEELIDELDHPDALDTLDDDGDDGAAEVLSSLYVASDVLVGAPDNVAAALELAEALDAAKVLALPYGIDPPEWDELCRRAGALAERLGGGGGDAEVAEAARALRTAVRPLV